MSLLEVEDLQTYFFTSDGVVRAVDGVSFEVETGESLGLVGESGAGKSVAVKSLMGLIREPGRIVNGSIKYDGQELTDLSEQELRRDIRGNEISIIFQDAMSALNPVFTVGEQIEEVIVENTDRSPKEARERAIELLDDVGIPDPEQRIDEYPHQYSGGMQQRAMIAMALACDPQLIIADEPTTALDVTIQAGILELFEDIKEKYETSMVYVTHDLGVVREVCDRVAVMYLGRVVESAPYEELYRNPKHPYTQSLINSVVTPDETLDELNPIGGTMPSAVSPPSGCRFRTRCSVEFGECSQLTPPLYDVSDDETHTAACLRYDEGVEREEPALHESTTSGPAVVEESTDD
ncbi:ABC-type transport system ATP-binding protein (probable substrate dipeptide/oligopeptide) (plasmid) [Natrialba magadii ATCC 43099]|uniref:Nickel import system ATP-binding protein NikD n=1 Tax=Natrialba magadii (strain ATCC 43099 / DSM 3394 / CCM 3739 / CIP 104546 / IAM 13178 / JCM 8861 / NBRC 102185 / NCIMB 2190 / MS3) TaxID=547559 RepID=D3T0U0_NATMM|nr:ABC transporter ATP-binding protein [Natrialba magadii]ADD07199.1 ABC-type transport system ATP-binding protein (probable substrate dipeptide/oligopeptide) [Natrialba magadii ATCC 43099]ELY34313.1 peptide ABC transporter ATPase [Natrialba magadii ATCC 43099]